MRDVFPASSRYKLPFWEMGWTLETWPQPSLCRHRDRSPAGRAALPYACLMTREDIEKAFADEGLSPHSWSNNADYFYEAHSHDYGKVLYCVQGEVTFHMSDGEIVLHPGQRLDIPAGTRHAATVGPDGVNCMEASKYCRG